MKQRSAVFVLVVLLSVASALAAQIDIQVEPAGGIGPIIPDTDVLLNVFIESNDINLLAATAVFRITGTGGFTFVDDPNLINSGRIFIPLDTNQLISGAWTMDGTAAGGMAVTINIGRKILGKIKVRAPASGNLVLTLDPASEFWESRTVRHTLGIVTISPITVTESETIVSCTGDVPADAQLCEGDGMGLTMDIQLQLVAECTADEKCEYFCRESYELNDGGTACVERAEGEEEEAPTVDSVLTQIRIILENDALSVIQKVSAIVRILRGSGLIN